MAMGDGSHKLPVKAALRKAIKKRKATLLPCGWSRGFSKLSGPASNGYEDPLTSTQWQFACQAALRTRLAGEGSCMLNGSANPAGCQTQAAQFPIPS
jgi:hypothetical protein